MRIAIVKFLIQIGPITDVQSSWCLGQSRSNCEMNLRNIQHLKPHHKDNKLKAYTKAVPWNFESSRVRGWAKYGGFSGGKISPVHFPRKTGLNFYQLDTAVRDIAITERRRETAHSSSEWGLFLFAVTPHPPQRLWRYVCRVPFPFSNPGVCMDISPFDSSSTVHGDMFPVVFRSWTRPYVTCDMGMDIIDGPSYGVQLAGAKTPPKTQHTLENTGDRDCSQNLHFRVCRVSGVFWRPRRGERVPETQHARKCRFSE